MSILSKIKTREELDNFVKELDDLGESLYKRVSSVLPPEIVKAEWASADNKKKFLEGIKEELGSARFLEMTVPTQLAAPIVEKIAAWVKDNVGADVVLDLDVESEIMAGAQMSFEGKFKDYSLKEEIEEALMKSENGWQKSEIR